MIHAIPSSNDRVRRSAWLEEACIVCRQHTYASRGTITNACIVCRQHTYSTLRTMRYRCNCVLPCMFRSVTVFRAPRGTIRISWAHHSKHRGQKQKYRSKWKTSEISKLVRTSKKLGILPKHDLAHLCIDDRLLERGESNRAFDQWQSLGTSE